jgi:predicted AlkP superfamily phosphohydrolase/phosphomutase
MGVSPQSRALAVGLDAADSTFVRDLIERGKLPTLARLLESGTWARVDSRGDIGSSAVWPTFLTGTEPIDHGIYFGWVWNPETMACTAVHEGFSTSPFWRTLAESEETLGVLDVPFATPLGVARGFEVLEWGPHDRVAQKPRVSPSRPRQIVTRTPHPFSSLPLVPGRLEDRQGRQRLSSGCVAGARLRGDLAVRLISETNPTLSVVVFTEIHHVAHQLWHTVEPDHHLYADPRFRDAEGVRPTLVEVYEEVDRQVARVIEAAGSGTAVIAFSLHGMRPGPGIATVLEPLLIALEFTSPAEWRRQSWGDRGRTVFGAAKRRVPSRLKARYHRASSHEVRHRLARSTIVPPYDWSRTRAFPLPTEQHGSIRINVVGREAKGIVPEHDYHATCDQLVDALQASTTVDGKPLVRDVLRTADGARLPKHLPDLVVHWEDAALLPPVRVAIGSVEIESEPIRTDWTGQHTAHGFCIFDHSFEEGSIGEEIAGRELHRVLLSALGAKEAPTPAT